VLGLIQAVTGNRAGVVVDTSEDCGTRGARGPLQSIERRVQWIRTLFCHEVDAHQVSSTLQLPESSGFDELEQVTVDPGPSPLCTDRAKHVC
jgi:hypothetical protein